MVGVWTSVTGHFGEEGGEKREEETVWLECGKSLSLLPGSHRSNHGVVIPTLFGSYSL